MIKVELRTPNTHDSGYKPIASLHIDDERGVHFDGHREAFDTRVAVIDRRSRQPVRFEDDAETWARNLDTAYRAGDLVPVVTQDTNPNPPVRQSRRPDVYLEEPRETPLEA